MSGNCFNSNTGSPLGGGGPPRVSIGKLCLSRGRCSKKILCISFHFFHAYVNHFHGLENIVLKDQ